MKTIVGWASLPVPDRQIRSASGCHAHVSNFTNNAVSSNREAHPADHVAMV